MRQNLIRLLVALPVALALVAGVLILAPGGGEAETPASALIEAYETPPSVEGLFAAKPPCEPYNAGLCKLTGWSCFDGVCCCTWRTDCDPAHASTQCYPQ